jgi:hypothetical protein
MVVRAMGNRFRRRHLRGVEENLHAGGIMNVDRMMERFSELSELSDFNENLDEKIGGFDRVVNRQHRRPDMHAFLLLDSLVPGSGRMVVDADNHNKIYLGVSPKALAKVITDGIIIELIRCGVFCSYLGGEDKVILFMWSNENDIPES